MRLYAALGCCRELSSLEPGWRSALERSPKLPLLPKPLLISVANHSTDALSYREPKTNDPNEQAEQLPQEHTD